MPGSPELEAQAGVHDEGPGSDTSGRNMEKNEGKKKRRKLEALLEDML